MTSAGGCAYGGPGTAPAAATHRARVVHRFIQLASVVGDATGVLDVLVRSARVAAVARAGDVLAAVQDDLNGQVDVRPRRLSHDLHAVSQRRHRAMGPTRAAVHGNVLVQGLRHQHVHTHQQRNTKLKHKIMAGRDRRRFACTFVR